MMKRTDFTYKAYESREASFGDEEKRTISGSSDLMASDLADWTKVAWVFPSYKKQACGTTLMVIFAFLTGCVFSQMSFAGKGNISVVENPTLKHSKSRHHDGNSDHASRDTFFHELSQKTPLELPLQPPFRIVQIGHKRTGSTFQLHLLDAIAQLKSGDLYQVNFQGYLNSHRVVISEQYEEFGESFVAKSHKLDDDALADRQKEGKLVVFTSGATLEDKMYEYSLLNQEKEDLYQCSLCQVDKYRNIFGLTDEDVGIIKSYLGTYEIIRQCCGMQMSKYEEMRLDGCDMTPFLQNPVYPHCERYDKGQIEQDMISSPIPHRTNSVDSNWSKPGDCARFDQMVREKNKYGPNKSNKGCPAVP